MEHGHNTRDGARRRAALRIGAALALAAWSGACAADDLFELPIESLMQLPVSVASPFGESVMDSASSVAVLRPEDWQVRGARSLEDALEEVPSVVSYASLGGASASAIRGYSNDLSVRGTATLLDGVPINNYSYATAAYDLPYVPLQLLDRVEVIRGPGSTLYGSDAFHGVLSINTWQPGDRHRVVRAEGGSYGDAILAATGSAEQGPWRANAGIADTRHGNRGLEYDYTDPATGAPGTGVRDDREDDTAGFAHLEAGNAEDGLWRVGFYADDYESEGFPGIGTQFYRPLGGVLQTNSLDFGGAKDRMGQTSDFWMVQGQYERAFERGFHLDVRTFEWQSDQTWILDGSELPLSLTTVGSVVLPCRTSPTQTGVSPLFCPHTLYQGTADRRQGVHALLRQDPGGNTQWAIGAGSDWLEVLDAPLRRVAIDGSAVYQDSEAPFNGAKRRIDHVLFQGRTDADPWSLVYGVRWDDYSDIGNATSPRLGLIYHEPGRRWSAKALYSHAFRAPTAGEQYGTAALQLGDPNLEPETIDTTELVWQYQREQQDSEVVLFRSHWQDAIVLTPVGVGVNQYANSGKSDASGVELVQHLGWRDWRFEGNASWVVSENETSEVDYVAFPRYIVNLGVGRVLGHGWDVWLNERALLDMAEGDAVSKPVPKDLNNYYRTDLHVGWERNHLRCALDVRNLFDRTNVMPALFNASGGLPDEGISAYVSAEYSL